MIHDNLFVLQESIKKKNSSIQSFKDGGTTRRYKKVGNKDYMYDPSSKTWLGPNARGYVAPVPIKSTELNPYADVDKLMYTDYQANGLPINLPNVDAVASSIAANRVARRPRTINTVTNELDLSNETPSRLETETITYGSTPTRRTSSKKVSNRPISSTRTTTTNTDLPLIDNTLDLSVEQLGRLGQETIPSTYQPSTYITPTATNYGVNNDTPRSNRSNNWMGVLSQGLTDLASLAPVLSNLGTTAESFDTVYNPYAGQIMSTMAGRKYDIAPVRRALRENRAISNYNASQSNTNTGANMAYRLQSQVATDKAIADLYSQKSNIENQYRGEYANTLNNLGQQFVSARNMSTDLNARSRAAARNINREALSQISNYAQNKLLMGNQRSRDMAMLDAYAPFLESVYTTKDYSNLMNKFRR